MNRSNIMNVHLVHRGVLIYPLMAAIVRFCVAVKYIYCIWLPRHFSLCRGVMSATGFAARM